MANKYHIRYNTKHGDSNLRWRVYENGVEHLASGLNITVPVIDQMTIENGVEKWNISCVGVMNIVNGVATITGKDNV